ncbi:MAG: short chain dehydrogenase [Verrucomicrobia bacterium]|nr:short chain dehydrogenase [Verrucomicrobiota bacterium]
MRVLVIGGKGTLGSAIVKELSSRHQVLVCGRHSGDGICDITSEESIRALFEKVGPFDAVVAATGTVHFEDFSHMTSEKYLIGLMDKLMGQVNLVRIGTEYIQEKGSFTLTSGILSCDPIRTGSSASMVNAAIEGFVRGVAIELPRQLRINAVCPTVLQESMGKYAPFFRGYEPIPAARAALAYSKSVEGCQTGQIYQVL